MTPREQPLVAFVCRAPVLAEALDAALSDVADVRSFPAGRPDPEGLIRALRPDALVVDDVSEADRLAPYARAARTPLILIHPHSNEIRLHSSDGWETSREASGIEEIRNLLVAELFSRGRSAREQVMSAPETNPEPRRSPPKVGAR